MRPPDQSYTAWVVMNRLMAATISGALVGVVEIRHRLVSGENGMTFKRRISDHTDCDCSAPSCKGPP